MRRFTTAERRARLAVRHHLAEPAATVAGAAADLVGLHSSDPASPYLSLRARVEGFAVPDLDRALYDERSLVRMVGMRRTLFVVPAAFAPVVEAAASRALAPPERRRLITLLEGQGIAADGARWLTRVQRQTLAALARRGSATAAELTDDVPLLGTRLLFGAGTAWEGEVGVSTRVLFLLATEGVIVRARPRGSWISAQYRWARTVDWLEEWDRLEPGPARAILLAAWLRRFGPATITDAAWWTGWPLGQTRSALAACGAVEVALDDGTGFALGDDLDPPPRRPATAAFLPGLDPTVMGWKQRDWYLGPHGPRLFDRNGNAGPTIWWEGRVVGGWTQRPDGTVVHALLEDPGTRGRRAVVAAAAEIERWLDGRWIRPRFPTPIEAELRA